VSSQITASKEVQMVECLPTEHDDKYKTEVSKTRQPVPRDKDPVVQKHGTAWCPGSPLVGWKHKVGADGYDYNYDADAINREFIEPTELEAWEQSWSNSSTAWKSLSTSEQRDCYLKYHENGFGPGDACLQVVGSRCRTGHKTVQPDRPCAVCCIAGDLGGPGAKYPDCDGNEWYLQEEMVTLEDGSEVMNAYCHSCKAETTVTPADWIMFSFAAIAVAGVLMKFGVDLMRKFKALKPPMMTLITFMQVVNLFTKHEKTDDSSGTGLHWPDAWQDVKGFFSGLGSIFNFSVPPFLSEVISKYGQGLKELQPQCIFVLPYWQKWMLWMLSPWLLLLALRLYYYLRILLAKSAVHLQDTMQLHQPFCEECQEKYNVSPQLSCIAVVPETFASSKVACVCR
jgi:hypothetical protein